MSGVLVLAPRIIVFRISSWMTSGTYMADIGTKHLLHAWFHGLVDINSDDLGRLSWNFLDSGFLGRSSQQGNLGNVVSFGNDSSHGTSCDSNGSKRVADTWVAFKSCQRILTMIQSYTTTFTMKPQKEETRTAVDSHETTNVKGSKLLNSIVNKGIFVNGVINGNITGLFEGVVGSQESIVDCCGHVTRSTLCACEATGRSSESGGSSGQHDEWKRCV